MARQMLFCYSLPIMSTNSFHSQTKLLVLLLRPSPVQPPFPQAIHNHLVLLLAERALDEARPQHFLPPVHALRVAQVVAPHVDRGDGLPVAQADGFDGRTQLFVFMFRPSSFGTES